MEDYSEIIEKARELAQMIENHDITIRYRESLEKMKGDAAAQRLLSELIRIGGELHNPGTGDSGPLTGRAELEILKDEFEKNQTVKDHILNQKQYLNLIALVQERIKNPVKPH